MCMLLVDCGAVLQNAMEGYAERVAQYNADLAAFNAGTNDTLEWSVKSTAKDREAVSAALVRRCCAVMPATRSLYNMWVGDP